MQLTIGKEDFDDELTNSILSLFKLIEFIFLLFEIFFSFSFFMAPCFISFNFFLSSENIVLYYKNNIRYYLHFLMYNFLQL